MISVLRRAGTSLLLIVFAALAARVAFAWYEGRQFPSQVLSIVPFQTETGHIAYSIASGKGFSSPFQRDSGPTAWVAPVYPYLLAGIFKVFGVYTFRSFLVALSLNILFSSATCVPIFFVGKRIAGIGAASAAAWLWAIFPNAIIIPFEWIWDTCLSVLLVATLLWATLKLAESGRTRDWCLYGLLWGFTLLTNPAAALLFPFLLLWVVARWRAKSIAPKRPASWLIGPAMSAAVLFLCCVPWTVRNYVQFHRLIPLRSNFAFELYIGNNENYDDQHRLRPGAITQDREILRYLRLGETAFMDEEKRKAMAFIKEHPRIEAWLIAQRFVDFWLGTSTPVAAYQQAGSFLLRLILVFNDAAPLGAFLGIVVLLARRNSYVIPVLAFLLVFPLLYYLTHTSLRYRHPIDPIVLLLAVIGIQGLWLALAGKSRNTAATETSSG